MEIFLYDIYHIYSESDYITLFENLAAKAALVEYKKKMANEDSPSDLPVINKNVVLPTRNTMKHQVFICYSRKDKEMADALCEILKDNGIEYWVDCVGGLPFDGCKVTSIQNLIVRYCRRMSQISKKYVSSITFR